MLELLLEEDLED